MQLELGIAMALETQDTPQLDHARSRFAASMDTFGRAQRMFLRHHRAGDAHDALLAQAGTDVYRAFYTSRNKDGSLDNYAVRRAIGRYIEEVSAVFASANKVKEDTQAAVLQNMVYRATLILLQEAASEELRHLILPTPLRTNDREDVIALHLVLGDKINSYDIVDPIRVRIVDGSEIEVTDHEVLVGREALNIAGSPDALLQELIALLGKGTVKSVGKKAKKAAKQPKQTAAPTRSDEVRDLSERLAYAISDAYEYESD